MILICNKPDLKEESKNKTIKEITYPDISFLEEKKALMYNAIIFLDLEKESIKILKCRYPLDPYIYI